ncbi:MAG: type VI secretion system ATPase TssH, partial [Thermodesulfobacteriota bacterium]
EMQKRVTEVVRSTFKPEFLNRVDEMIIFHALGRKEIKKIIEIQLGYLDKRLAEKKLSVRLSESAKELLADQVFDPVYGARPLKRAIQKMIQDPLALKLLEGDFSEGEHIEVDVNPTTKEIVFNKGQGTVAA